MVEKLTALWVSKDLALKLTKLKIVPRESYERVIRRLLKKEKIK